MPWYVYDPAPELADEGTDPKLYGPFLGPDAEHDAREFANVMHPDDSSGDCVLLQPTSPLQP